MTDMSSLDNEINHDKNIHKFFISSAKQQK